MFKIFTLLSLFLSSIYAIEIRDLMLNNPIVSNDGEARCNEFPDRVFVESPRGCRFYYFCTPEKIGEASCPIINGTQLHFHPESESCQLPENSDCTLDDDFRDLTCPEFGFDKIPHPYLCSKYTGE